MGCLPSMPALILHSPGIFLAYCPHGHFLLLGPSCSLSDDLICFPPSHSRGIQLTQVRSRKLVIKSVSPKYNQQEGLRSHLSFPKICILARPVESVISTKAS